MPIRPEIHDFLEGRTPWRSSLGLACLVHAGLLVLLAKLVVAPGGLMAAGVPGGAAGGAEEDGYVVYCYTPAPDESGEEEKIRSAEETTEEAAEDEAPVEEDVEPVPETEQEAEPEAEPEPVTEPEPEPESKPEPEPETTPVPEDAIATAAAETPPEPETRPEPRPEQKPEPKPEPKPAPAPEPEPKPEATPKPAPETKPRATSADKPRKAPRMKTSVKPRTPSRGGPAAGAASSGSGVLASKTPGEGDPAAAPTARAADTGDRAATHVGGYLKNPRPRYPRQSINQGEEGTVTLEVVVEPDGSPSSVRVVSSSGFSRLDRSAKLTVKRSYRFIPARRAGTPIRSTYRFDVNFSLMRP